MPRESFVFRNGECIPKRDAIMADRQLDAKNVSSIPFPYVMGDIGEYRSTITGEVISGRKQHRDHLRAHGCVEMGNDRPRGAAPATVDRNDVARDIKDAMEQVESGYVPPEGPIGTKDEEGNVIEKPEIEEISVDASIESGTYIRSETTK